MDQVGVALGAGSAAEFDALVTRGQELALQPQDIVEIMEWKGMAAVRAGRREEGVRQLEEALEQANKTARLTLDRIRRQLNAATGEASRSASPARMEG
jgi:hypothetical protein